MEIGLKLHRAALPQRNGPLHHFSVAALDQQVLQNVIRRRLFRPNAKILVGVSGGVDSMVLLHLLHQIGQTRGWQLTVAHLNHRLRGNSSLADERLVRQTAAQLKLPAAVCAADVRGYSRANGLSLEMAARRLRHDFLARAARERGISTIALAHQLDDQVELFFLRLLRGSGSQGLAGMKWRNPSPGDPRITLVRPLLNCPKHSLREYAAERRIAFREDATNDRLDIPRNRLRHELLPLLERHYCSGIARRVWRLMDILSAESEFINSIAEAWLKRRSGGLSRGKHDAGRTLKPSTTSKLDAGFASAVFESLPVALQRRCLQLELIGLGITPEFDVIEHLRLQPARPVEVARAAAAAAPLRLVRGPGGVVVAVNTTGPFRQGGLILELGPGKGELEWDGVRFAWQILPVRGCGSRQAAGGEFFDADKVGPRIVLRHWRPGDRFQPSGMLQTTKLQDLFVNQKVPRERRRGLALASTEQGELFWVEGLRISERFKLTELTIRRLQWAWQRL